METILSLLPIAIATEIDHYLQAKQVVPEEIRLRINRPIEINTGKSVMWLSHVRTSKEDAQSILNRISDYSLYRLEEELRQGYITVRGGHRIGISGSVIIENGYVKAIKHVSSFNIRLATDKVGITKSYLPYLYKEHFLNTLIIGPPQSGKTTFLRDLARFVSTGTKEMKAHKTAIVDERSEICAATEGVPMSSIGLRVDVLDRCPKSEGMMMFVRSMSPDVIIVDEIGSDKDVQALMEVMNAGINLICTIHGKDLKDIQNRPAITPLINAEIFDRFIVLSNKHHTGEVLDILDSKGHPILERVNQS